METVCGYRHVKTQWLLNSTQFYFCNSKSKNSRPKLLYTVHGTQLDASQRDDMGPTSRRPATHRGHHSSQGQPRVEALADQSPPIEAGNRDTERHLSGGDGPWASAWGWEIPSRCSQAHLIECLGTSLLEKGLTPEGSGCCRNVMFDTPL